MGYIHMLIHTYVFTHVHSSKRCVHKTYAQIAHMHSHIHSSHQITTMHFRSTSDFYTNHLQCMKWQIKKNGTQLCVLIK